MYTWSQYSYNQWKYFHIEVGKPLAEVNGSIVFIKNKKIGEFPNTAKAKEYVEKHFNDLNKENENNLKEFDVFLNNWINDW